jgi:hypothetical protein
MTLTGETSGTAASVRAGNEDGVDMRWAVEIQIENGGCMTRHFEGTTVVMQAVAVQAALMQAA